MINFFLFLSLIINSALSDSEMSSASSGPRSYSSLEKCWRTNPTVFVCEDLKIPKSRVEKAVSYWKKLGYAFESIEYNYSGPECSGQLRYGSIAITIPRQTFDFSKMAITDTSFNIRTKEIYYSLIQMPEFNVTKERVLEHELGHALGWNHSRRRYYIMNKDWKAGGFDSTGLSIARYSSICSNLGL